MTAALKLSGVTLPGSGYQKITNFLALSLPITSGLVGLYQFGGNLSSSLVNLADAAHPLSVIGSPVINAAGGVSIPDNTAGFDTGLAETAAFTFFAVAGVITYSASGQGAMMVGNFGTADSAGGNTIGASLFQRNNNATDRSLGAAMPRDTSGGLTQLTVAMASDVDNDWNYFEARTDTTTGGDAAWGKSGTLTTQAPTLSARAQSTRNLRVGGHPSGASNYSRPINILCAGIYNRRITDAERASNYAAIRAFYAQAGIATI